MNKEIKQYLKKFSWVVNLYRFKTLAIWWLYDIRSALLSRSTKLKMTPYGFKLKGTNSIHHIGMQEGMFEINEVNLFQNIFKRSDVFVDIGANIGFYSCLGRMAGLYIVAVEPLQKNLKYLYDNIQANKLDGVEIFPVALAEHPGVATLFGGSSTGASLIGSWAGASKMFRKSIALSTLDILLGNRFEGKKIFIKVDVEGSEYQVLLGAESTMTMQPMPTWVLEICLGEYHPDGVNPHFQDIFDLFWRNGYEARTADQNDKLIKKEDVKRWVKCGRCDSGTINFKFEPPK
jgi:FkbM family methyltransferase